MPTVPTFDPSPVPLRQGGLAGSALPPDYLRSTTRSKGQERALASDEGVAKVAIAHGGFFLATGVWPLLSLRTFELVTGPKLEGWLVKGMGVVLSIIGATVLSAGLRRRVTPEIIGLANGAGLGLGLLDVLYVARRRIKPVYLADAVAEAGFAAAWALACRARASAPAFPQRPSSSG